MPSVDLRPIPEGERNQSPLDLFLIFAGANIAATTLQVGATLAPGLPVPRALLFIAIGSVAGAALVAALAPLGPRLGAPSVVALRAPLGFRGASFVAALLYLTNFAWIAVNNVIAASPFARLAGGPAAEPAWAVAMGVVATAVVAFGPRAVRLADRLAVPLLFGLGALLTWACLRHGGASPAAGPATLPTPLSLDIVIGYQVSWILMFADYSRFTRSARRGAASVFLGLAVTSLWFMPLGFLAARAAGSNDPATMLDAVGLGAYGALLLGLAAITTNFVNIYLSALAWKSLFPRTSDRTAVFSIGLVGAGLSLFSRGWLDRFADLMLLLGGLLVPVGGILLAFFFVLRRPVDVEDLYRPEGPYRGLSTAGVAAWVAGAAVYYLARPIGGTLPSLLTAVAVYVALARRRARGG